MEKKFKRRTLTFLLILPILLAGCTSQYLVPLDDKSNSRNSVRTTTKSQDGVEITVLPSIWEGNPYYLKHHITPVYIEIKNNKDKDIIFDYRDSALITYENIQYSPLSPQNAAGMLSSSEKLPTPGLLASSIEFGFGFGHFHRFGYYDHFYHPYYHHFHSPFYYRDYYYPERTVDTSDVYAKAITLASIRPGAILNGFIYFNKLPDNVEGVSLEVSYKVEGDENNYRMEFPFAVLKNGY